MQALNAKNKAEMIDKFPSFLAYQCCYNPPYLPFTFVSEGCESLTGYLPEEITSGTFYFLDMVHPDDAENVQTRLWSALSVGASVEVGFRLKTKTGTEKRVLSRSRVSETDDSGMPHVIEGFFTDITRELQLETTEAANRANSDFLSKMGYEVRTPMNAILGLTEISLRENLPENIREYAQTIKKSGRKLMSALDNIMDFKNIESGNLKIITKEYDLTSLVNDIVCMTKEQIGNLEFHVFVDSKMPNMLIGDVSRLRQVINSLLSNAVKFTEKGFISLSIEGEFSGNTINLIIKVEDTGRGIKEDDRGSLFKEFTQFDSKVIEGTGLGLSITRSLVELMGGDISVESGYGIGCVFTVKMPQGIKENGQPVCTITGPENKNILVLEHNPIYASSIKRTLKNLGVNYTVAINNGEFVNAITNDGYTHVFADAGTHSDFLFKEFKAVYPNIFSAVEIVLLSRNHNEYAGYRTLIKPVFCLSVADIFDDKKQSPSASEYVRFDSPKRVLVVDDIRANFTVATGFLQPYNMITDFAESGAEAIEAVKLKQYDLILMDHLMPGMTGTETTGQIREMPAGRTDCKNVPIIALTANTDYESRELFLKTGANDFLPKPLDAASLSKAIQKWLPTLPEPENSNFIKPVYKAADFTIPGVDTQAGITKTGGSIKTYLLVLKNYYDSVRQLIPEMKTGAEHGDMEGYYILAHAIGGISESIGADGISVTAKQLEKAAKSGDLDFVQSNTPDFLNNLQILLNNIRPVTDRKSDLCRNNNVKAAEKIDPPIEVCQANSNHPPKRGDANIAERFNLCRNMGEKPKILLIDDTDSYLIILDEILAGQYETLSSLDGEDGIETAKRTNPDLILLDLVLPGMSGYDVLNALKADETLKHIPVILMSAQNENVEKGKALGAAGFCKKPFEAAKIKEAIASLIRRK